MGHVTQVVEVAVRVAVRVEGSRELVGQPEVPYGVVVSWGAIEGVSVSAEYLHGEYDEAFGANADGKVMVARDLVTAQLSAKF